jgi:hypothetical protein
METERITLSQRERDRWRASPKVQQMHLSQVAAGSRARNDRQTHLFELLALSLFRSRFVIGVKTCTSECLRPLC